MFCLSKTQRIVEYFLICVITLSLECFASTETVHNDDSHEEYSFRSPRRLLYSSSSGGADSTADFVIYIVIPGLIGLIALLIKCCKWCSEMGDEEYSGAVVHPPPRRETVPPPPPSATRRYPLRPPRSSSSIILPQDEMTLRVAFIEVENPNFYYGNSSRNDPPKPMEDLPPSYDTVVRNDALNSSSTINAALAKDNKSPNPKF